MNDECINDLLQEDSELIMSVRGCFGVVVKVLMGSWKGKIGEDGDGEGGRGRIVPGRQVRMFTGREGRVMGLSHKREGGCVGGQSGSGGGEVEPG